MPKTCTELTRHVLNGPTMGTRWSVLFFARPGVALAPIQTALQQAVDEVDAQMSLWKPDSDLMRLNRAPPGTWVDLPAPLAGVLALGLAVGRASDGAFDVGLGDAVQAWGFGPQAADAAAIRTALTRPRQPAHALLELSGLKACKHGALHLDLNGIAKGYGVDRLADVLRAFGFGSALVSLDGEVRALGLRPEGEGWNVALEAPEPGRRAAHAMLVLQDAAVATSGDYRHWVRVQGRRLSHTMDPRRGAPLAASPASVTVVAPTCTEADAWATALMVLGPEAGAALATRQGLSALWLLRGAGDALQVRGCGPVFATAV
jgi:thiamine biosynthesis lipoprotein